MELSPRAWNLRQYNHMDSLLGKYKVGRLPLGTLVNTLDLLFAHAKPVDEAWDRKFEKQWETLEIEYATILYREESGQPTDPNSPIRILEAVESMRQLLAPKLLEVEEEEEEQE